MSESTLQSTSRYDRMKLVEEAIGKTGMATAKVWNPWRSVVEDGVDIDRISTAAGGGKVPEIIPFGKTYADYATLSTVQRMKLTTPAKVQALTEQNFATVADKLADLYVEVGRANYQALPSANCTLFACCTLGLLAANPKLLGQGIRVEMFNLTESTGGAGHAYVVIGRADCDPQNIDEYGPDCFFIDAWYARQRRTSPGTRSVKAATPDEAGEFWDQHFLDEGIKNLTERKRGTTFTYTVKLRFTSDQLTVYGLGRH